MIRRAGGFRGEQLQVQGGGDPPRDLVLQGEEIPHVAIEPLRPHLRVGVGVDQLSVDADLVARATDDIIDPFVTREFDQFAPRLHPLSEVRAAIERYLAKTGPKFPKSLAEVMASGKFHPLHEVGLLEASAAPPPEEDPVVTELEADEARMRTAHLAAMDELRIDVLAFPTA